MTEEPTITLDADTARGWVRLELTRQQSLELAAQIFDHWRLSNTDTPR
jgi:hypothetical protein